MGMLDFWREPRAPGVLLPAGRLLVGGEPFLFADEVLAAFARRSFRKCSLFIFVDEDPLAGFLGGYGSRAVISGLVE